MVFKFIFKLVFIIVFVLGLMLIFIDIINTYNYSKVSSWKSSKARIIQSELVYKNVDSRGRTRMKWCFEFLYEYYVNNQRITSNQIRKGNVVYCSKSKDYAYKEIANYPYGSVVDVYYDPTRVSDSVLELKIINFHSPLLLGVFLSVLGFFAFRIKRFRKSSR
ncbi:DUF3592 domain-containing protein [Photobacterium sp. Ph5]|nr:DUF3592 domain-containing protein [Photobacterium sp. Ph6]MCG3874259.1 DUF3592 domain-containing protein [Photobacterium sp. Ph5]